MRTKRHHLTKSGELETAFVQGELLEAYDALAREALDQCRKSIMMAARFLNAALWRLPLERAPLARTLSTGASALRYDPERVVERYRESESELTRDCLHAVLHCMFQHPFDRRRREPDTWSLASDISAELAAMDLCGTRFPSRRDEERLQAARRLSTLARNLTAPALYQLLRHGGPGEQLYAAHGITGQEIQGLHELFARDAHGSWANAFQESGAAPDGGASIPDLQSSGSSDADDAQCAGQGASEGNARGNVEPDFAEPESADDAVGAGQRTSEADQSADQAGASSFENASEPRFEDISDGPDVGLDASQEEWGKVGKLVEAELRMQRRRGTDGDGSLLLNLAAANKKPADYDSFLKRFATLAEDVRVNDDEFDYVFYTYGLNRYGNMPLVEPLEYVESNRVREFVIALDTSGSCSGDLIRSFVQRTYDILRQRTSFGDSINVHIVQCDKEVRAATKITSLRQLEEYRDSFWVSGGGGTDFKPVFAYVDSLVEQGEFNDLRGLIYFTDGYGSFPVRAPEYEVAFVFVDVDALDVRVPPWAMKVMMTQEEVMVAVEPR